jgi:osmotically-inducible protein OsmY
MNQELSDLQIRAHKTILEDNQTRKHGIEVFEKEEGVITLKGSVPSRKVKKAAASILRDLPGVKRVVNKLQVKDEREILEKILR